MHIHQSQVPFWRKRKLKSRFFTFFTVKLYSKLKNLLYKSEHHPKTVLDNLFPSPKKPISILAIISRDYHVITWLSRETLLEIKKFIVQKWAPSKNGPRQSICKSEKANLNFTHFITWYHGSRDYHVIMTSQKVLKYPTPRPIHVSTRPVNIKALSLKM